MCTDFGLVLKEISLLHDAQKIQSKIKIRNIFHILIHKISETKKMMDAHNLLRIRLHLIKGSPVNPEKHEHIAVCDITVQ